MSVRLIKAFGLIPLPIVRGLGWLAGSLMYWLPSKEKVIAQTNLKLAFPALPVPARRQLLRDVLRENARTLIEMPAAWSRSADFWMQHIEIADGGTLMREKLALGKGVLVAAPHQGNWEVGVHALASLAPATILYRPPRQAGLEQMIVEGRSQQGAALVPIGAAAIRAMYGALKKGEMVTILPDQQPKIGAGAGVFAPFFGHPAWTMTLFSRLARRSGAPVLYTWAERLPGGRYRLHFQEADPAVSDEDEVVAATALNAGVERVARTCPSQYLWTYARFKHQPEGLRSPYQANPS